MRTAKYNDFTLLRIIAFIVLVILGILAYRYFVKPPCEHNSLGKWVTVDATCTEDGYHYRPCNDCGAQVSNLVITAKGHKLSNNVITIEEATCTKAGTGYKACATCGEHLENVVIPALGHQEGETVIENEEEHTALTKGDYYEEVTCCVRCNAELSRNKVEEEHDVKTTVTNTSNSTCTIPGNNQIITYCNDCDKQLSITNEPIALIPHNFVWELTFENGEYTLDGKCADCDHDYDPNKDSGYAFTAHIDQNRSVKPSCVSGYNLHVANITLNGVKVAEATAKEVLPADPAIKHSLYVKLKDADGKWLVQNPEDYAEYKLNDDGYIVDEDGKLVDFLTFAKEDENGTYFNVSTLGIVKVKESAWDENGFATGAFKCTTNPDGHEFDHWITVRIYNDLAEDDSAENGSVENDSTESEIA